MTKNIIRSSVLVWVVFLLLGIYFVRVQPLTTNDTYYHLSVGREVVQAHKIPQKDNFVYGSANTNYVSTEWLSGVIFYLLINSFGFNALLVPRIILGLITVYFVFRSVRLFSGNTPLGILTILAIGYLLPYRLNSRPEMFSLAFIALTNYVCLYAYFKKRISHLAYFLPIVFLLWPNLHGFSILGLLVLTFFSIILLSYGTVVRSQKYKLSLIFILCILSSVFQYQRVFVFQNATNFSSYITEWVNLWQRIFPSGTFAFFQDSITSDILIFIAVFVGYVIFMHKAIKTAKRLQLVIAIFYFLLLLFPLKFYRLITPIIVLVLPYFVFMMLHGMERYRFIRKHYLIRSAVAFLMIVIISSSFLQHQLGSRKVIELYPESALKFIKSNTDIKKIFTIYLWNDYIIWNLPKANTFSDAMSQYRTLRDLGDEKKLHSPETNVSEIRRLLTSYNIDTVVNTQSNAANLIGASINPVYNLPNWNLVYVDNHSAVYIRADRVNSGDLNLSAIHPEFDTPNKYNLSEESSAIEQLNKLLRFDKGNDFARSQLIYFYFIRQKDLNTAKSIALQSRTIDPEDPFYSFILAAIYLKENDCKKANDYAEEANKKNIYDASMRASIVAIFNSCEGR